MHFVELICLVNLQAASLPMCLVGIAGHKWICVAVLGRVVGGQLLVALKVGGTCFD